MRADGKPPSPKRTPSLSFPGIGSPDDGEDRAAVALHGQLIDPAGGGQRSSVDPLAHLDPLQSAPPLRATRSGPTLSSRSFGANDDELAGIFDDEPEGAAPPSLLDPVQKPSYDPLSMLDQFAEPGTSGGSARPAPVPSAPVNGAGSTPPDLALGRDETPPPPLLPPVPPPRASLSIIPDNWDPGLALAGQPSVPPPALPPQVPPLSAETRRPDILPATLDIASLLGREPARPVMPPPPVPPPAVSLVREPAEQRMPDAITLLLQREAARSNRAVDDDQLRTGDPTLPERAAPKAVAARPSLFGDVPADLAEEVDAAPAPSPPPVAAASDAPNALWQALGIDASRLSAADQERLLTEIGETIREVSDGLIQILAARKHLRSEFRVDQTMVGATQNNLFKFTRNADELLSLTMTNRNRVFLPMNQAAREAFNDIKAHEMATLAAVQLAIRAVLDRFQPAKLARQAEEQPRGRFAWLRLRSAKTRCWEFFTRMYTELAADADEASNRIFTVEFGRAYRERTTKGSVR